MEETVKIDFSDGTLSCAPCGDLDHHAERRASVRIDRALYEYRPRRLIIDLSSVGFADSSALGLIMGRRKLCEELSVTMSLCGVGESILSMLRLTGLRVGLEILQKT